MRVEITARSLEITDTMREHIEKRMLKLKRYFDGVLECHVIARLERFIHKFEITLHGNGFDLFAEAHAEDLHVAFESAADKMERQVKKLKDKIKRRRPRKPEVAAVGESEIDEETDIAQEYEGR
jgi:putative sigma-54 modulation protein